MGVLSNSDLGSWIWEYSSRIRAVLLDEGKDATDKIAVAKAIYSGLKHRYGFKEALLKDNYAPTPDELSEVNCGSQMLIDFLVAKELGLNPEIIELDGFRKANSGFISKHALIKVDVKDTLPWTIDQSFGMIGPIKWDKKEKIIIVANLADDAEEKKEEIFNYTIADHYSEEEYEKRLQYQRSPQGAASVLITGQRGGFFSINKWKMQKALESPWYIKYHPEQRTIESLVIFQRSLIQNRGIINRIHLDEEGQIINEELTGYFYREDGFAEILGETPMFLLPINKAENLSHGLGRLPVDQHYSLETKVQAFCLEELEQHRQVELIVDASKESLKELNQRDKIRSDARFKFILTEALYQYARKTSGNELIYSARDRTIAFERLKDVDEQAAHALREIEHLEKTKRLAKKQDKIAASLSARILDPKRRERENVDRYLSIRSQREMMIYQMENSMKTFEEAGDRIAFIQFDMKDHLVSLNSLEKEAKRRFGSGFEKWLDAAYARLFTEFLGNTGASMDLLRFLQYRHSIIDKVQRYQYALFKVLNSKETEERRKELRIKPLINFLAKITKKAKKQELIA